MLAESIAQPPVAEQAQDIREKAIHEAQANAPGDVFSRPVHYFVSSEVDSPAVPLSDWVVRVERLRPSQQVTLRMTLFVNASGVLDDYVLEESSLLEEATRYLLQDLRRTTFAPAVKGGRAVASEREVEIMIDNRELPFGPRQPLFPPPSPQ